MIIQNLLFNNNFKGFVFLKIFSFSKSCKFWSLFILLEGFWRIRRFIQSKNVSKPVKYCQKRPFWAVELFFASSSFKTLKILATFRNAVNFRTLLYYLDDYWESFIILRDLCFLRIFLHDGVTPLHKAAPFGHLLSR